VIHASQLPDWRPHCPCVTPCEETESPETLSAGANVIGGRDGTRLEETLEELSRRPEHRFHRLPDATENPFGAGQVARHIVEAICDLCESAT
jgi:UDP-N-acetylglucosamine 2-epimerase